MRPALLIAGALCAVAAVWFDYRPNVSDWLLGAGIGLVAVGVLWTAAVIAW